MKLLLLSRCQPELTQVEQTDLVIGRFGFFSKEQGMGKPVEGSTILVDDLWI